jgi:SARP family transcriptional regulator, regulator of embCAB operon
MRIDVLGELRLLDDCGAVRTFGGRAEEMLRLLVTEQDRAVTVQTIINVLWGDHPPRSAMANIHTYASRIRAALSGTGGQTLVHGSAGYRLALAPGRSDLSCFTKFVARGRSAMNDPRAALDLLRAGVALWHGSPITPAMRDRSLTAAGIAGQLEELRLGAYADLVDAACRAGDPAGVIPDLRRLVAEHPRRESMHALLLRALYEAGEPAAALWAYHDVRRSLAYELGVEPGLHLRALYRTILHGVPS